jgi:hypothetical protein
LLLDTRRRLERQPPGAEPEMGVSWEPEPDPTDNSPFSVEEQDEIHAAITAVKIQLQIALGDQEDAKRLAHVLDTADERARSGMGRLDWRERFYGALIDAGMRGVITGPHVKLAFDLLRVGIRALTGLEIPEIGA